jgi:hypothetical protein
MDVLVSRARVTASASGATWWISGEPDAFYVGHTDADGQAGAGFYTRGWGGGSDGPFDTYVLAGFLPAGASTVRVEEAGETVARGVSARGAWIAVVPWGNRDAQLRVIFEDDDAGTVRAEDEFLYRVRPLPKG